MHCLCLHRDLSVHRLSLGHVSRPCDGCCLGSFDLQPPVTAAASTTAATACARDKGRESLLVQPLREEVEQMATDPVKRERGREQQREG